MYDESRKVIILIAMGLVLAMILTALVVPYNSSSDDTQPVIRETTIRIVEDTLSVDDSRVVSRTTVGKQSFLIFKLGHHYQVFEEKK